MDRRTADDADKALRKIERMIADNELVIFSKAEADALKEVAKVWHQLKAVVTLGGAIGSGLKWVVMIVLIWGGIKSGLFDWLKAGIDK